MSRIILHTIKWVIATAPEGRPGPGVDILCTRCGLRDPLPTPCPIDALPYFTRGFQEFHRYCKEKA